MGIELPAELTAIAAKAGVSWPKADEDAMRSSATAWRDAGDKIKGLGTSSDGAATRALGGLSGAAGDAARGRWAKVVAPDGDLQRAARGCHAAADRLDHAAQQVGAAKVEIVRELVTLAKNNDAATASASAGNPNALLGLDTLTRGTAANVANLHNTLSSAIRLDSGVDMGQSSPPVNTAPGAHGPGGGGGLLSPVTNIVGGVVAPVAGAVAPAIEPVAAVVAPVTGSVAPVVGAVTDAAAPVLNAAAPVTAPAAAVLQPGLDAVPGGRDVLSPALEAGDGHGRGEGPPGDGPGRSEGPGDGPGRSEGPGEGKGLLPGLIAEAGPAVGHVVPSVVAQVADVIPSVHGSLGPVAEGTTQASAAVLEQPLIRSGELPGQPAAAPAAAAPAAAPAAPAGPVLGSSPAGAPMGAVGGAVGGVPSAAPVAGSQVGAAAGQQSGAQASGQQAQAAQQGQQAKAGAQAVAAKSGAVSATGQALGVQPGQSGSQLPGQSQGQPGAQSPAQPGQAIAKEVAPAASLAGVDPGSQQGTGALTDRLDNREQALAIPGIAADIARHSYTAVAAGSWFMAIFLSAGQGPRLAPKPARQLPPPAQQDEQQVPRFAPQEHPQADLVDTSFPRPADATEGLGEDHPIVQELLKDYDPLAGMHERDWESLFQHEDGTPRWPVEREGGYEDSQPEVLKEGAELDRFGTSEGRVLSRTGTPFAQRSLPPSAVSEGYRRYRVIRDLPVHRTISAPWFGQPGGGSRYRTTYPVADLVALGYLTEITA